MSFEKMRAVGIYPPTPTLNQETGKIDQAVFVPEEGRKTIPLSLAFGGDAHISERRPFFSEASQRREVPYVISGVNGEAVSKRFQEVFNF